MGIDSVSAYEIHAREYLRCRDTSGVGIQVAGRWARSLGYGSDVVEIACGGGLPVTRTLIDAGLSVWAIDSSPTLVAVFEERFPGIPVQCATVQESDFFRRRFAAAISVGLVFLLSEADQIKMFRRVSEILEPGASFLFTAPLEQATWTDASTAHSCISLGRDAYEKALEQAGFRVAGYHEDSGKNNYYEAQKFTAPRMGNAT